jgi:AcrR family transcriptional regulator
MPNRAAGLPWDRVVEADSSALERPRVGLSTKAIVEAAIALADVDGIDAVSIRRVAAVLEVRPMSLYTHIVSKDELFALMADELIGTLLVESPLPDDWREALSLTARKMFRMFVSHPWLLALFTRRPRPGPNAARNAKQTVRAVESLKIPPEDRWRILGIVNDYVLGGALRIATSGVAKDLVASLSDEDRAEQPELTSMAGAEEARLANEGFEAGLQTVLDGIEHRILSGRR